MAFEFDPADRAAFRAAIEAAVRTAFPDATLSWIEYDRRLLVTFVGGATGSIWEPNFYFSRGEYYTDAYLLGQIVDYLAGQRTQLTTHNS